MTEFVPDVQGQQVFVGDTIAAAFTVGRSAEIRVGIVTGFGTRKSYPEERVTVLVDWSAANYSRTKSSYLYAGLGRFVKIPPPAPKVLG
jgi:hypothetical protein